MATVIEIPSLSPSSTFGRLWPADSNASEDDGLAGVAILLQKLLDDAGSGRHPRRRILAAIMVVMVMVHVMWICMVWCVWCVDDVAGVVRGVVRGDGDGSLIGRCSF